MMMLPKILQLIHIQYEQFATSDSLDYWKLPTPDDNLFEINKKTVFERTVI